MIKKIKYVLLLLFTLNGMYYFYNYSPYKIEFLGHYDKIWAHRVNSIEKAKIATKYFNGIELDLDYFEDDDFLDVNHPPTKSIHLSFSDYLIALDKTPFLWLDIKNLNISNAQNIAKKLMVLFKKNNYPLNKVLIETRYPKALPVFTKLGFKTSYYLPSGLEKKEKTALNKDLLFIKSILEQQENIGLSFNYDDYKLVNELYPNKSKYLWIIDGLKHRNYKMTNTILNDTNVKVVLIRFKTFNGHR